MTAPNDSGKPVAEPIEFQDPTVLMPSSSPSTMDEGQKDAVEEPAFDPKLDRKVKLKLDFFILPIVSLIYFFSSMGRSDLGNAKIAGLSEDLSLSPSDYSNAATTLLVGTIVFQLPGTILIKQIRPNRQFSAAMMTWGFLTAITLVITNSAELLALRFLIGGAEAFVQGGVFYLSFWYQYHEYATRGAFVSGMSTLAGAFNGLIAYAIAKNLDGKNGWRAWRWIFLIEGIAPVAFSFVVLALLPSHPSQVRWGFSAEEKEHIMRRSARAHNTSEARLRPSHIFRIMLDLHFWLFILMSCASSFCLSSLSNFLPDIISGFGFEDLDAQLFTTVVYACGCAGIFVSCRIADKTNQRGYVAAGSCAGAIVGYALLISVTNRDVRFFATCLVSFCMYPTTVLHITWAAMSFVGYTRRGAALAWLNILPHIFAISGNQAYQDPPIYRVGNTSALVMSVTIVVCALLLRWRLAHLNKVKKANQHTQQAADMREKSIEDIGDHHPDFFYIP
ncbi:putative pantothenate transporter [Hypoxylon sp. FL1284]|nr:putative pantothenate transporter [Hypoxylon sp. FL1284]